MLSLIFWLLVVAVVAAVLGFGGVASFAGYTALFIALVGIGAVVMLIIAVYRLFAGRSVQS